MIKQYLYGTQKRINGRNNKFKSVKTVVAKWSLNFKLIVLF